MSLPTLITTLLPPSGPLPLSPLPKPTPINTHLTAPIAAAQLHPVIESLLHILNNDLPSAHFLLRHMERPPTPASPTETDIERAEPPKAEGLFVHGILHRVEGDYENARAWWRDGAVCAPGVIARVHTGGVGDAEGIIDATCAFRVAYERGYAVARRRMGYDAVSVAEEGSREEEEEEEEFAALKAAHDGELRRVWSWCVQRYGVERWVDASGEFGEKSDKYRELAGAQLVGGEGWRVF